MKFNFHLSIVKVWVSFFKSFLNTHPITSLDPPGLSSAFPGPKVYFYTCSFIAKEIKNTVNFIVPIEIKNTSGQNI